MATKQKQTVIAQSSSKITDIRKLIHLLGLRDLTRIEGFFSFEIHSTLYSHLFTFCGVATIKKELCQRIISRDPNGTNTLNTSRTNGRSTRIAGLKTFKTGQSFSIRTATDRHWNWIKPTVTCRQFYRFSPSACRSWQDVVHLETQESIGPQTFQQTKVLLTTFQSLYVIYFVLIGFLWQLSNTLKWWRP